jgi:cell division protein FtsL
MMRFLNLCVLGLLVAAAAYVYEIKFESTLRAERVAKMRGDVQRERDAIAALRAEWTTLENPARIQGLARRHLRLQPADANQYSALDRLPEKPAVAAPPVDAIADKIEQDSMSVKKTAPTVLGQR